jgi:hypothetical protein
MSPTEASPAQEMWYACAPPAACRHPLHLSGCTWTALLYALGAGAQLNAPFKEAETPPRFGRAWEGTSGHQQRPGAVPACAGSMCHTEKPVIPPALGPLPRAPPTQLLPQSGIPGGRLLRAAKNTLLAASALVAPAIPSTSSSYKLLLPQRPEGSGSVTARNKRIIARLVAGLPER